MKDLQVLTKGQGLMMMKGYRDVMVVNMEALMIRDVVDIRTDHRVAQGNMLLVL